VQINQLAIQTAIQANLASPSFIGWLHGSVIRLLDWGLRGHDFDCQLSHCHVTILGNLFMPVSYRAIQFGTGLGSISSIVCGGYRGSDWRQECRASNAGCRRRR